MPNHLLKCILLSQAIGAASKGATAVENQPGEVDRSVESVLGYRG